MTGSNYFFAVNKPTGITSFGVLREMRRILGIKKIGHTGTLDPLATGLLLVATGNCTKLISELEHADKTYRATIMLNGNSPSYDRDSEITFLSPEKQAHFCETLTSEKIDILLQTYFLGDILQTPPAYSALKLNGKTALQRIMAGETVTMTPRKAHVYDIEILEFSYPRLIISCHVGAGTYVRSIAHELGEKIGSGGYIQELERTNIGNISLDQAIDPISLDTGSSLNPEILFPERVFPLTDEAVLGRLAHGQRVAGDFPFPQDIPIFLSQGENISYVVEYKNGVLHPRKKIV